MTHETGIPERSAEARIRAMEQRMDKLVEANEAVRQALRSYRRALRSLPSLQRYYEGEWRSDFEADEQGLLPPGLKRGVLSEDALWNALAELRTLSEEWQRATTNFLRRRR